MFVKAISSVLLSCILFTSALASVDLSPAGYELPDVLDFDGLLRVSAKMYKDGCLTASCLGYLRTIAAFWLDYTKRGSAGNAYIGHIPDAEERDIAVGRDLTVLLRDNRRLWPWMCKALVAIEAREDMSYEAHSPIATFSIDTARRITTPKLDCLGQVLRLIPASKHRDISLFYARRYCVSDRARDCRRLAH